MHRYDGESYFLEDRGQIGILWRCAGGHYVGPLPPVRIRIKKRLEDDRRRQVGLTTLRKRWTWSSITRSAEKGTLDDRRIRETFDTGPKEACRTLIIWTRLGVFSQTSYKSENGRDEMDEVLLDARRYLSTYSVVWRTDPTYRICHV